MIPQPSQRSEALPAISVPLRIPQTQPFWNYKDLLVFVFLLFPSLAHCDACDRAVRDFHDA